MFMCIYYVCVYILYVIHACLYFYIPWKIPKCATEFTGITIDRLCVLQNCVWNRTVLPTNNKWYNRFGLYDFRYLVVKCSDKVTIVWLESFVRYYFVLPNFINRCMYRFLLELAINLITSPETRENYHRVRAQTYALALEIRCSIRKDW